MGFLDFLGIGNKVSEIEEFAKKGAIIIDVRSSAEYKSGSITGSKNIPLDTIFSKVNEIKRFEKPIIVCCRSGMRSAQAASILKNNGIETLNGGSWQNVEKNL